MKVGKPVCLALVFLLYASAAGEILFEDYTDSSGLESFHELGYGTAMPDYDGDGLLDIFVVGQGGQNRLFRNLGDLRFSDVTSAMNIRGSGSGWGVCFGDFDSDNDEDIYVSRRDNLNNDFFIFDNGTFHESAHNFLVDDPQGYGYAACFAPLTKDLSLDLVVANQSWPNGRRQSCRFFAGNIDLPFTDLTQSSGITDSSEYWDCVTAADYDNDGNLDLLISAEPRNRLYHNNGNGHFTDVSDSAHLNLPLTGDTTGYGITWGDYDNDGWLDVYISCWHEQFGRLFKNNGDGTFTDVTRRMRAGYEIWSHSVSFGDFDNDGWVDLYSVSASYGNMLYKNNQGDSFTEIGEQAGVRDWHWGCGLSIGDLDRDGRLDLVVGHYANGGDDPPKASFYRNITQNTNNWLEIKVNGFPPNPNAIGARVRLVAGSIAQIREVSGGSGFGSQNMLPLHFGLGTASVVDSLIITYPIAHIPPIVYTDLAPNGFYELPDVILDVASIGMLSPEGPVDCEMPLQPCITIANLGNVDAINFKVLCEIKNDTTRVLVDSLRIGYLAMGDSMALDFAPYALPQCGSTYHIEGIVQLFGDQRHSNDTVGTDFYAGYAHDMACGPIINPGPDTLLFPLEPSVTITNCGISLENGFNITCDITLWDSLLYSDQVIYDGDLSPNLSDLVRFPLFQPAISGRYKFSFTANLANDRNRSNDSISVLSDIFIGDCRYILGDINYSGRVSGLDVIYGVNYFKGGNPPPFRCLCGAVGPIYVAGDVNASCAFNGADITCLVNYFLGFGEFEACPLCPPMGLIVRVNRIIEK